MSHGLTLSHPSAPGVILPNQEGDGDFTDAGILFKTRFGYRFGALQEDAGSLLPDAPPAQTYSALDALGNAMIEQPASQADAPIAPVFTYLGQFIDHDVTLFTDRDSRASNIHEPVKPRSASFILSNLSNRRRPTLALDSVYGDGPSFDLGVGAVAQPLYEPQRPELFRLGNNTRVSTSDVPAPADDLMRDLPRVGKQAIVADKRNDENLIVAQLHLAFLRFHNMVVKHSGLQGKIAFDHARELTTLHYQSIVVDEYLRKVCDEGTVDAALAKGLAEQKGWVSSDAGLFMPLEFATAAFRFGHSMVRPSYDFNVNFNDGPGKDGRATLELLFLFTGNGDLASALGGAPSLPSNWIADWPRLVVPAAGRQARAIDTRLASILGDMTTVGIDPAQSPPTRELLRHLARRNLRRGFQLRMPTGQAVAEALGEAPLSPAEVTEGDPALARVVLDGGFDRRSPLWFYVLKEAEVRGGGKHLGPVGSRIVAETLIGLLAIDPRSALRRSWRPADSPLRVNGAVIDSMERFLQFAGVMV